MQPKNSETKETGKTVERDNADDWRQFYEASGYYSDAVRPFCLRGRIVINMMGGRPFYVD